MSGPETRALLVRAKDRNLDTLCFEIKGAAGEILHQFEIVRHDAESRTWVAALFNHVEINPEGPWEHLNGCYVLAKVWDEKEGVVSETIRYERETR